MISHCLPIVIPQKLRTMKSGINRPVLPEFVKKDLNINLKEEKSHEYNYNHN